MPEGPISACYSVHTSRCRTLVDACPLTPHSGPFYPPISTHRRERKCLQPPLPRWWSGRRLIVWLWFISRDQQACHHLLDARPPATPILQHNILGYVLLQRYNVLSITLYWQFTSITIRIPQTVICKYVSKIVQDTKAVKIYFHLLFYFFLYFFKTIM